MPAYTSHYPPVQDDAHVKATVSNSGASPWLSTDPTKSLIGTSSGRAWSTPVNPTPPIKFSIDHGEPFVAARIYLENQHYEGSYTYNRIDQFEVYGTNSSAAFANVAAPADLAELTLLGTFQARAHISRDVSDPQYFLIVGNTTPFRYTVLRALNLPSGAGTTIVFRRIEIQSSDDPILVLTDVGASFLAPYQSRGDQTFVFTGQALIAPYRAAKKPGGTLGTPYRAAWQAGAAFAAPYQATFPALSIFTAPYRAVSSSLITFLSPYRAGDPQPVEHALIAPYRGKDAVSVRSNLLSPYRGAEYVVLPAADSFSVSIAGVNVDPIRISITWSRQQAAIEAELEFADESIYSTAKRHASSTLDLFGYRFALVVDGRSRREEFGQWSCTVRLASQIVQLEYPWAAKVDGELTGLASEIAQTLAGEIPVSWQTIDWYITPGRWIAASEAPLSLLQKLVSAVGAIVLSMPDGSISVQPRYAIPVPSWQHDSAVSCEITTANDVFAIESTGEHKDGVNSVTVRDQEESVDTIKIEEDTDKKKTTSTQVLVYQTPWTDDFILSHRGDIATASLEPMGVEERTITDEEIIVQDGSGSASYPIYSVVSARYNKLNLGTPTYSEDGSVKTAIEGDSILLLSYRTRARRYLVREVSMADLLLVAESAQGAEV